MSLLFKTLFIAFTLILAACSSTVKYDDATKEETLNTDFGSTDLQRIATKMVDDLLAFAPMVRITNSKRPIVFVDTIRNKTAEHIDMESITDTIQSKLLNSGKYRFIDMGQVDKIKAQLNYQRNSGLVDQNTAMKIGRQIGAEYMLYGNMAAINKSAKGKKDVYSKFTLKLLHIETGILEWSSEKEIRKTREKRWFGS